MANDDDDDALMISATRELMHINLYWSLTDFASTSEKRFTSAVQHSAAQLNV